MKLIDNGLLKFDYQFPLYNFFFPNQTAQTSRACLDEYGAAITVASADARSRALYIHIPFCETICSFCPFTKGRYQSSAQIDAYTQALTCEIEQKARVINLCAVPIRAIFFGGGTPSLLSPANILALGTLLHKHFDLSQLAEFSFEFSIGSITAARIEACKQIGVTHARYGLQTIDRTWRTLFNLDPDLEKIEQGSALLSANFDHVLCDILYGMNGSTEEQTLADIDYAVSLGVSNIDIYPINNVATSVKLHKALKARGAPIMTATRKLMMKLMIDQHLRLKGYVPYNGHGYRHAPSARQHAYVPDYQFIYHQHVYGYADHDLLGFGVGAISTVQGFTLTNTSSRDRYCSLLAEGNYNCQISQHDETLYHARPLVMGLPYHGHVTKAHINFSRVPQPLLARLDALIKAGLLIETDQEYVLTREGWLWYSNLMFYLMPETEKHHFKNLVYQRLSTPGREIVEDELIYIKRLDA
jgi:oxygen-independent coproporphyrinogen-3 oxidase